MIARTLRYFRNGISDRDARNGIMRILSIAMIGVTIGATVILVMAFVWRLEVLAVAFSGVISIGLASYLFLRLWPKDVEETNPHVVAVQKAIVAKTPKSRTMSPEEYRRQRAKAQKMIAEKAAPALAKAIRGILRQAEMEERKVMRR